MSHACSSLRYIKNRLRDTVCVWLLCISLRARLTVKMCMFTKECLICISLCARLTVKMCMFTKECLICVSLCARLTVKMCMFTKECLTKGFSSSGQYSCDLDTWVTQINIGLKLLSAKWMEYIAAAVIIIQCHMVDHETWMIFQVKAYKSVHYRDVGSQDQKAYWGRGGGGGGGGDWQRERMVMYHPLVFTFTF